MVCIYLMFYIQKKQLSNITIFIQIKYNTTMLIGIIPDVHQTIHFMKMVETNINHLDKLVFLGDYVDHWYSNLWWHICEHNPINIINKIIDYKQKYPKKIELLLGNHCLSYLSQNPISKKVSGHQHEHDSEIAQAYLNNISLFKIAVEYNGWVISHAGFSKTWVTSQKERGFKQEQENIIDWCNKMLLEQNFHYFDWTGHLSPSGDEVTQTPTWIRPFSLIKDSYFNNQLVGHSETEFAPIFVKDKTTNLILVDSPEHTVYFELDTQNPPKFETVQTVLKNISNRNSINYK